MGGVHRWATGYVAKARTEYSPADLEVLVGGWPEDVDMTERLERMTPSDHGHLQAYLRKNELFGERLAGVIEAAARDDGLSFERTFGMRSSILQLSNRMSGQSPALAIDPIVSKVRRIEANVRSDAEEARRLAARVGEKAFWAHQERVALLHDALGEQEECSRSLDAIPVEFLRYKPVAKILSASRVRGDTGRIRP